MTSVEKVRKPRKTAVKKIEQVEPEKVLQPDVPSSDQIDSNKTVQSAIVRTIFGAVVIVLIFVIMFVK